MRLLLFYCVCLLVCKNILHWHSMFICIYFCTLSFLIMTRFAGWNIVSKYFTQYFTYCKGRFTHSMPHPCHSPAMPCQQGFRMCLSHLIYTVRPCLTHTFHAHAAPMPCFDHAVLLKATAQHGRQDTACGLPVHIQLLPATIQSSTKIKTALVV